MGCPNCGAANPPEAAFCMKCGTPQAKTCAQCSAELPDGAAFCMKCGHKVEDGTASPAAASAAPASPPPPAPVPQTGEDRLQRFMPSELAAKLQEAAQRGEMKGERRTVTMLFCDVKGSTTAAENLDPEEWADIMNGAFEHLIAPVYRYEGTLARLLGDAVLAFFGAPIAHEDDPERAVRAGLEIIDAIGPYREQVRREWGIEIDVRVGINTGLVVVGAVGSDLRVEYTVMGDAVNVAARMEQTAEPGTVRISENTKRMVDGIFDLEDLGALQVKGRTEPVGAFRVEGILDDQDRERGVEGMTAPLVGRDRELAIGVEALEGLSAGHGCIVSLIGDAGLGKSRLIAELRKTVDSARVEWRVGRSLSFETATPYAPVRLIVADMAGIGQADSSSEAWDRLERLVSSVVPSRVNHIVPFLAQLLEIDLPRDHAARVAYLDPGGLRAETVRACLELFEGVARARPLVVVFEDLHWADSATIDLVSEMLRLADRAAFLLLLAFRPRRDDPSWPVHETAERDHPHRYRTIRLAPLDGEDARRLVSALLDIDALTERVRAAIVERADGNPFFLEEVIRSMIDHGVVDYRDGRWIATGDVDGFPVPENLGAVLTTRLDRLDADVRSVAQAASVIGREFRFDELAALVPDVGKIEPALVALQRRDLIRETERVPRRVFRFKHALVVTAAYDTLLLKQRRAFHAAAADHLQQTEPGQVGAIADHLVKSGQREAAVPFLVSAGQQAARAYAIPEAIRRLELALEIMGDDGEPDLVHRALESLGQAKEFSFDLEGAADVYARLRAEGERHAHVPMQVSGINKAAFLKGFFTDDRDGALAELSTAEELSSEHGHGLVENYMFQCYLRTSHAEFDEVESYMSQLADLGRTLEHDDATLFGMAHLTNTLAYLCRFDEVLENAEATVAAARERGDLKHEAAMLTFPIPITHLRNGDVEAALAAIEAGMEIALHIGDRISEAQGAVLQAQVAMGRGAFDEAVASAQRAVAATEATGVPYLQALGRCVAGTCYQQIGGPMMERALDYHNQALGFIAQPTGRIMGAWLWGEIGHCLLSTDEIEEAERLFTLAMTEQTAPMYLMRPLALMGLAEVALRRDDVETARSYADELEAYVEEKTLHHFLPSVAMTAAQVLAARGEAEAALPRLDEAVGMAAASGMHALQLRIETLRADLLDSVGRTEEAADARRRALDLLHVVAEGIRDDEIRKAFRRSVEDGLKVAGA